MKLSKKILAAFSAATLLATAAVFTSCAEDDDTEGAISGSGNNYTVSYKNESSETYRAYNGTNLKHSGGTFLIKIDGQSTEQTTSDGTMGIMWDKHKNDKELQDFFVAGASYGLSSGKIAVYVSKFINVADIQAANFGAETKSALDNTSNDAQEYSCSATTGTKDGSGFYYADLIPATDGTVAVVVDVQPNDTDKDGTDGGYTVTFYNSTDVLDNTNAGKFKVDPDKVTTSNTIKTFEIDSSITGYTNSFSQQNALAVYANIRGGHELNGSWTFGNIVNADEVVEE